MFEYCNRSIRPTPGLSVQNITARTAFFALASLVIANVVVVPVAQAQENNSAQELKTYRIAAGPLEPAVLMFAGQAGVNLSIGSARLNGLATPGLTGTFSVEEGFSRLLENNALRAVKLKEGNYTLVAIDSPVLPEATPPAANVMPNVVVTARTQSDLIESSRQITTIEREQLQTLRQGSDSLATLLAKAVPGMADSSHTITESGQTLRGRETLVLVDGVPLNTNRGSSRNLANINLANVEQVEVLRGSSAIYGSGATGGIISIRTRRPEGKTLAETTVTGISPLSELDASGLGGELQHYMSGAGKTIDYTVSLGARHVGGSFDAKGNRIAPEPSQGDIFDSNTYNIATKLGYKPGQNQRLQLSGSYYDIKQNTDYASDPSVARLAPGSVPAASLEGLELEHQNRIQNTLVGLDYEHLNLRGNTLAAQLYYRDFFTRFSPFDARKVPVRGANVDQSMQNSEVSGGRVTIKSPLGENKKTQLVWGADFHDELTDMPLDVFNPAFYDASGGLVFQKIGKVTYMPEVTTKTSGAFAQLQHRFNKKWSVEGGARYDRAKASFDDFIPLSQSRVANPGTVAGGTVDYDAWTYNAGAVYSVTKAHEFYASFSQGFQLPDIGLQVRNATPAFNINSSNLQAVLTDSLEFGWRGRWTNTLVNLSVFESRSDLGAVQSFNNGLRLTRTKERIQGVEGGIDYFTDDERWSLGSTITWMQGEELPQNASRYQDMPGNRIPPLKFTAYVDYRPTASWSHRLQSTAYEGQDYRLNGVASFGRRDTSGYTTVDLISQWKIDNKSSVVIGVENLLNRYYYPLYSQLMRNDNNTSHLPASGTVLKLSFTHNW